MILTRQLKVMLGLCLAAWAFALECRVFCICAPKMVPKLIDWILLHMFVWPL